MPYAASFTFNFTDIGKYKLEIVTAGAANISGEGIQVTPTDERGVPPGKAGRATYNRPLHLWDRNSNELASFSTCFTFVIDPKSNPNRGDGLTFFLAEDNSVIADGGAIGLPVNDETGVAINSYVAVEFDTQGHNNADPKYLDGRIVGQHVGINVNSLTSSEYQIWKSNISSGVDCQAWINYESVSQNLSVSWTCFQLDTTDRRQDSKYELERHIDMKEVLPEWVIFGFSAATGGNFETHLITSWSFNASDIQIGKNQVKNGLRHQVRLGLLLAGLFVLITSLAIVAFVLWRKKKNKGDQVEEPRFDVEMNIDFEMGTGSRKFSYLELAGSTSDFAEKEKLGEGSFGAVYKGLLKDSRNQGVYASEVKIISTLRHRNLVRLIGCCHEKGELLLVYEFMENGSLDSHLFKAKSLLTWGTRYKIALGLASALLYLHEEWEQCVLHRDIKSSNVMLDSNFNAKLGDFGLAKLVDHEKGSQTTLLAGTLGYMAPECISTGKASKESDVFSFGVVALEIACGRKSIDNKAPEMQISLVEWVRELYETGTLLEAADPRLGLDFEEEQIRCLMIVGLSCVQRESNLRPSMRQAIQVLNFEASLPTLPSNMPVESLAPSMSSSEDVVYSFVQNQSWNSVTKYGNDFLQDTTTTTTTTTTSLLLHHHSPVLLRILKFISPPEFLNDEDILMDFLPEKEKPNNSKGSSTGFYGFGSHLSSPVEFVMGSTEIESDEEDYLTGLTRKLCNSTFSRRFMEIIFQFQGRRY
ncbi:hypothetical protein OSB04_016112 [Centaurea solstitialis]|uniref:non-specific serine/threonine protein kinase n=1 Tax=Centaurea solstitialis TaxID=347529 RepID=A0AA38W858_9ASTR|nr:hypothetical protein OSB04_016112 [Centaurea solstitialis]